MTRITVTIDSELRIEVPSAIREELDLAAGDSLMAQVRHGVIVLVPRRGDAVDQSGGLYREVWVDQDVQAYIDEERDAWDSAESS